MEDSTAKLRGRMIQSAKAYNKYFIYEYLESKNDEELLCFVHSLDRAEFKKELEKFKEKIEYKGISHV